MMFRRKSGGILASLGLAVLLTGCSSVLPRSGPDDRAIVTNAAVTVRADSSPGSNVEYILIELSKSILPFFDDVATTSLQDGFGGGRGGPAETLLGTGDVIQLSIFEAQSGGLFIPESGGSAPGNYVTLPPLTVDREGYVNVPYAGRVRVAGRRAEAVENDIQNMLANRAIEPQVIITVTQSRSNRLSILGDVNSPSELEVSPRGERILDVISRAGGLNAPGAETYVTITRGGQQATALFRTIVENPEENIFVRSGDTVYVSRERRTYLAFGATGATGRFDFEESNLTFGEALAKAGGLIDSRADPSQVFLYRLVDASVLARAGIATGNISGRIVPVVFQADMTDPGMLFAVQTFTMQDKDIIYISNSGSVELSKFLNLINGVSGSAASVPANALTTSNAVGDLVN